MGTHSQTYLGYQNDPNASTNCGTIQRANDASPSYTRTTLADDTGPNASRSTYSTGFLSRAFFELRMAALVNDGYIIGTPLVAATLTYPQLNVVGHIRLVVAPETALNDSDADLFNAIGPSGPAWSENILQPGNGSRLFNLNCRAMHAIAALRASDTRIIGLCLVDESNNGNNIEGDPNSDYILTITTEM